MVDPAAPPPRVAPPIAPGTAPAAQGPNVLAPDAREIRVLALTAAAVAVAHAASIGARIGGQWLPPADDVFTQADALLLVARRFAPWLLGLAMLTIGMALRWLPRLQQRLREPSVVASWVTLFASVAVAWLAMRTALWPLTWMTTTPESATLLTRFWSADHMLAVGAWLAVTCLVVPLLSELFLRHALLAWLQARGVSTWVAVACTAVVFGLAWFVAGVQASPDAALRHGLVAGAGGLVLGALAVQGSRGRGLGLCVVAHAAWLSTEAWLLLRGLLPG